MSATVHASLTYPSWVVPRLESDRRLWMGIVLSILIHGLIVAFVRMRPPDPPVGGSGPLTVELNTPRAAAAPAPAPAAPTPDVKRAPPKPTAPPQLLTAPSKSPSAFALPPPEPVPERPKDRSNEPPSMMDVVNARRAQREAVERAAAAENAYARASERGEGRPSGNGTPGANFAQKGDTGGVFEILDKGHRFASFSFNGWNPSRVNKWREVIEVDAGLGGNVELAIVRRMIQLIREHYKGDFRWESRRLGQVITLSARVEDTAGLESFMVREFFGDERAPERSDPLPGDPRRSPRGR